LPSRLEILLRKNYPDGPFGCSTGVFALYEFKAAKYTVKKIENKKPVEEYLNLQGRFKHLNKQQIQLIQAQVDKRLEVLLKKEQLI